ncbi:hypothetical protein MCA1877 [Methylococcus capsulatus str. Bath]|uniref:Uncharacterized protein n=1 Tax=Methylococcus capsulatus (strain ATCC 33009 / NCIMB 11132 / Bath) TaxID=243233 RepID=Q606Y4_METCA|nr:hypothetical protein MCA1877 [Methylococcus capsulatus str. Bath]
MCATSGMTPPPSAAQDRSHESQEIALVPHPGDVPDVHGVAVAVGDGLVARQPRFEKVRKHPAHEFVGRHGLDRGVTLFLQENRQMFVQEGLPVIQRLGVTRGPFDQHLFQFRAGADVEYQRVFRQCLQRFRIVQFAHAAAGIVDEMLVTVNLAHFLDEFRHVPHRRDLGLPVQRLPPLEFLQRQATLRRVAELAQEGRDGREIVHRDVATDIDRIRHQEVAQERHLHRLALDVVQDRLIEIAGTDPVVAGIMEPGPFRQLVGQGGLTRPRHAEQGDLLAIPVQKLLRGQTHRG